MIINLKKAQLYEQNNCEGSIRLDDNLIDFRGANFVGDVNFEGYFYPTDNNVTFELKIKFTIKSKCDLCGADTETNLTSDIKECFIKDDKDADYSYTGDTIDLKPLISERAILAIPTRILCKKSCKGLCPKCGINRNLEKCNCKINENETTECSIADLLEKYNTGGANYGSTKKKNK
jgi:uncharacterized protein